MASVETKFSYALPSALSDGPRGLALSLVSASRDAADPAGFLKARANNPEVTAKALRAVSEIVGARFYVPPAMLAKILREADPVATVSPDAVRFEGFSACCSAYIRLDLADEALGVDHRQSGTTNVDFGPELRAALAQVRKDSDLEITIGAEVVGIARDGVMVIERKVPLPVRWLKGFAEVQVHLAAMDPVFSLPRVAALRFLRSLPRGRTDHLQWVVARGATTRVTARETPGAVPLRGAHRLRVLEALAPFAKDMSVYVNARQGSSAWMLDFGGQRLCLVLNAEPWRGFSGDGGVLSELAGDGDAVLASLRAQLNWQDRITADELADATGHDLRAVEAGLARLAASGLLGYDLCAGCYFHRVLPFDMDRVLTLNPRLEGAQTLVDAGSVTIDADAGRGTVKSAGVTHEVTWNDDGTRCTCPWYAKHKDKRGPCKHALAVEMALGLDP